MNDEQREASKPSNRLTGLTYDAILAASSCVIAVVSSITLFPDSSLLMVLTGVVGVINGLALFASQHDDIESLALAINRIVVKRKPAAAKEFALSLTYLRHLKRQHSITKFALLGCAVAFGALSFKFPDLGLLNLAAISIAFLGLIALKELLIAYRIRKGLFGTNRAEAHDLINFIVKNSSDIDFTLTLHKFRFG